MRTPIGYSALIERYRLPALPLGQYALLDTAIKGRRHQQQGGQWQELFEPNYSPEGTLAGHLQFALRYEGVNLQVLALLFAEALSAFAHRLVQIPLIPMSTAKACLCSA